MNDFFFNVKYGLNHVLDINGYDHVLFLMVLAVPYIFKDWKRVLLLVSLFTLGHTVSLVLAAYNFVSINGATVEFLIPITILIAAIYNVITAGKIKANQKAYVLFVAALTFGIIHGLGFAREFTMVFGDADNKPLALLEFALGIELAQLIIVFVILFLGFLCQTIFKIVQRDWIIALSSVVVGLVIPILVENNIF
ncbi:HupE/UreJ family protein [Winogradskyella litorisediminis]|uniref:HupE/UreJ family protein n=1 Tax=Winogradskyella litorisediminis TaxID=1156618 RepID=A0ABW3N8I0_9FLAO